MRVLLIDDHALFRAGVSNLLERRGIEVLAAVAHADDCVALTRELKPDIVLLDLRMPGMGGLEALSQLRSNAVTTPVVVLTTSSDRCDLTAALQAQANGYLLKDMDPDELVAAMREVLVGKTVVTPGLSQALAEIVQQSLTEEPSSESPFDKLTAREHEILAHLAEGITNKAIAESLGITAGTVKLHVKSVLRKLGLHSRVEAAVMAVAHGLNNNRRPQSRSSRVE